MNDVIMHLCPKQALGMVTKISIKLLQAKNKNRLVKLHVHHFVNRIDVFVFSLVQSFVTL